MSTIEPWTTRGILTSINAKNRIYRKYCWTKNQDTKEELYNSFKFHRNALNKLTRLSKANHYRSYFEEKKIKVIKNWDSIKEITHISKKRSQSIKNLNVHDTITSNSKIIANNIKLKKNK